MSNYATCNFFFLSLIATHFATRIYLSSAKETQQKLAEYLVVFEGFGQISLDCPMSRQTGWIPMLVGCPSHHSENTLALSIQNKEQQMATATLAGLKLTAASKSATISPVQQRRNKMSKRLWEQIQLATAQASGNQFMPVKFRTITDKETGLRKSVEVPKRVKGWWFTTDNGKTAISVRYGARVLELARGKFAVEIASPADLVPTLELIKTAIEAGELDTQIEAVANKLRDGFEK
jgi:hypothetical protein